MAYRAPVIPLHTDYLGAGIRSITEHEYDAWQQHKTAVDEHCGWLMEITSGLLAESKHEACQDTQTLVELSERASLLGADLHRYLETIEDPPTEVRT